MNKYIVEMSFGFGVSETVEAENEFEACEKLKEMVLDSPYTYCGSGEVEFEEVNFIKKV